MSSSWRSACVSAHFLAERIAVLFVGLAALASLAYTVAAAAGYAPWLELPLAFGGQVFPLAGMGVQIGVTALLLMLCLFLPGIGRIMALERSHRSFHIGMQDVARAYHASHAADRKGVFTLPSEFDSVRERIAYLKAHPDLGELEPGVLEVAAQMSHLSRDLGHTYSDAAVRRAEDFLQQRQQEIEEFNARIEEAKLVATSMRRWAARVALEEDVARAQLDRLRDDLTEILPEAFAHPEAPAETPADLPGVPATGAPDTPAEAQSADSMAREMVRDMAQDRAREVAVGDLPLPAAAAVGRSDSAWPSETAWGEDQTAFIEAEYAGDDRIVALLSKRAR